MELNYDPLSIIDRVIKLGYVEDLRKLIGHRPIILVGAIALIQDETEKLLMQKRKHPYGSWGFPGGLMELGESIEETAIREVYEETGLKLQSLELLGVFSGRNYFTQAENGDQFYVVTIAFSSSSYTGSPRVNDDESLAIEFFDPTQPPIQLVGSHKHILDTYLTTLE